MFSTIRINGSEIRKDSSMLFGDLINSLSSELAKRSQVISTIKVNGLQLNETQETKFSMMQLGELGAIDFVTTDPVELAFEALQSAQEYIRQIVPRCRSAGKLYEASENAKAEKEFIQIVDSLDSLTDLLSSVQFVLKGKVSLSNSNDSSLRVAQVRLISAIHELLPAKINNDNRLLADILLNELPEALNEMADLGIPVLMRLKFS